jgi:hypothetical protein
MKTKYESKTIEKVSLIIGIAAMVVVVIATVLEGGSEAQKILFVIGVPTLGVVAYVDKQKMFSVLQSVATVGAVLAFFPTIPEIARYVLLVGASLVGIAYLFKAHYYSTDKFGWLGTIGLLSIAAGLATNAILYPMWFGFFLGAGGVVVAIYSTLNFFKYKVKIALIWVVLNIMFSINPLLIFIKSLTSA